MTSSRFQFRYDGPREPSSERFCKLCAAVETGKNHKTTAELGSDPSSCPVEHIVKRKAAGKVVHCPLHCGLKAALAAHLDEHEEHDPAAFESFAADVLEHVDSIPTDHTHVEVHAWGWVDPQTEEGEPDLSLPFAKYRLEVTVPRA